VTIHYHGTPLTPRAELLKLAGKHFCVPFSDSRDADCCLQIGQSVMFDNGAFSTHTRGETFDRQAYYAWLEPRLARPHWGVIPDVIGGDARDQLLLRSEWPFPCDLGGAVWHMSLPIEELLAIADNWPRICFGSSREYWQVGSDAWQRRADEAFNALAKRHRHLPWVHMLRGLGLAGERWPFASMDSTNVALNYGGDRRRSVMNERAAVCPEKMARNIDARQCPVRWALRPEQMELIA
jgi:hypothetical protein